MNRLIQTLEVILMILLALGMGIGLPMLFLFAVICLYERIGWPALLGAAGAYTLLALGLDWYETRKRRKGRKRRY